MFLDYLNKYGSLYVPNRFYYSTIKKRGLLGYDHHHMRINFNLPNAGNSFVDSKIDQYKDIALQTFHSIVFHKNNHNKRFSHLYLLRKG